MSFLPKGLRQYEAQTQALSALESFLKVVCISIGLPLQLTNSVVSGLDFLSQPMNIIHVMGEVNDAGTPD